MSGRITHGHAGMTGTLDDYWATNAAATPLPAREEPCRDCAVVCGFYQDYVESLLDQPRNIQVAAARSWFCHNNPQAACRGAIDALGVPVNPGPIVILSGDSP